MLNKIQKAMLDSDVQSEFQKIADQAAQLADEATKLGNLKKNSFNVLDSPYNAKGDGVTDDTLAIKNAIADWEAFGLEGGILEIPAGRYKISSPINLLDYFTATTPYMNKIFNMSPSAEFIAANNMAYLLNIEAPPTSQFLCCTFNIGVLNGNNFNLNGMRVVNANDCKININRVILCKGTNAGVLVDQSGSRPEGCFNNFWDIQNLGQNTNGFDVLGSPYEHPYGFQGNIVRIAQVFNNVNGIIIDSNAPGNSVLNTFHIGVAEFNTGAGIIDKQGSNSWFIGNTSENTNGGFVLPSGALGIPFIHGVLHDGITLNNQIARIINLSAPVGSLPSPTVPVSGASFRNPYNQPVRVHLKGTGLAAVYVSGLDTLQTEGLFILMPGEEIVLSYTSAPTWAWFGM